MDIDTNEQLIAFCQEALRIPSYSGQEQGVAELMKRKMEEYGFDEVIIDRFGSEAFITPLDNGRLLASFDAAVSPVFFSFVFMLPQCRITHPEDVRLMYERRLEETLKMQKSEADK